MNNSKQFSEILSEQGFRCASERGLSLTHSPNEAEHGGFFRGVLMGIEGTVAVDETGEMWVKDGHIDLTPFGFKDLAIPRVH